MMLPFRRRHHDNDASHDRARALWSEAMLEPLRDDDEAWLARHLAACAECRREHEAYESDRSLLRSLRDAPPQPPRDLWARTSAALERESARRGARDRRAVVESDRRGRGVLRGWPIGVAAGALVVLVVVGGSLLSRPVGPIVTPQDSAVAVVTPGSEPTPISVAAADLGWIQSGADGTYELRFANVDEVCPKGGSDCGTLDSKDGGAPIKLGSPPTGVAISPKADRLVVVAGGTDTAAGRVLVVPVTKSGGTPSPTPGAPTATPVGSAVGPSAAPGGSPGPSVLPSLPLPDGALEIASDVVVIGEAAYSPDGRWLAFAARPSDGSTGPDLYLWTDGFADAVRVTTDHDSYFSGWFGNRILASRVVVDGSEPEPAGSLDPAASDAASASPEASPTESQPAGPSASPGLAVEIGRPISFLLDPVTREVRDLARADVWLPVVDPTGRFATYWSGTLQRSADGAAWQPGTGVVVVDGWLTPLAAPTASVAPSDVPSSSPAPSPSPEKAPGRSARAAKAASPDPSAGSLEPSASPAEPVGPAGTQIIVENGAISDFRARFDPTGTRLAVWVSAGEEGGVGHLHLIALDPAAGAIDEGVSPLPNTPALRGFSMDEGRLAWVTPPGQDGKESAVHVLGWSGNAFGQIETFPAKDLLIVR